MLDFSSTKFNGERRTVWRSVAASALHRTTSKNQRSRARSGQLQRRVGRVQAAGVLLGKVQRNANHPLRTPLGATDSLSARDVG